MAKLKYDMAAPYHPPVTPKGPTIGSLRALNPGGPNFKATAPGFRVPSIGLPRFNINLPSFSFTPPWGSNYGRAGVQGALKTGADPNNPLNRILK